MFPLLILFTIGGLWGGFYVLIKVGVTSGIHPINYLFWFASISSFLLFLGAFILGYKPRFAKEDWAYYLKLGFVRFTVANTIFYSAQAKLPIGLMAVIMGFVPIFTQTISLIARIEKHSWLGVLGICLGFGGALLIIGPKSSLPDPSLAVWVLIGFGAPFLHAVSYVALSENTRPQNVDSMTLSSGTLFAAALFSLPIAIILEEFSFFSWPLSTGEIALIVHAVLAAINFYAIFELIRIAGPTYMSQANFLAVGFGVIFGLILFDETHTLLVWIAISLMLLGVALVNFKGR